MALDIDMISLNKKIRSGLGFSLLILIVASILSYFSIQKLIDKSKWVDHTNEVLMKLENIITVMLDAESGVRGYALTNDAQFIEAYEKDKAKTFAIFQDLKKLTSDNDLQQNRMGPLENYLTKKYNILDIAINLHTNHQDASLPYVFKDGRAIMDKVFTTVDEMKNEEKRLLKERTDAVQVFSTSTLIVILFSSMISILVAIFSFYFINRDLNAKAKTQEEMRLLNLKLNESNDVLTESRNELYKRNYLLSGLTELNNLVRNQNTLTGLGTVIVKHLCEFLKAQAGIMYIVGDEGNYHLSGKYALQNQDRIQEVLAPGEGIIGQVASDKKLQLLTDIPADAFKISSSLISLEPQNILIVPFFYNEETLAVVELVSKNAFSELDLEYIQSLGDNISIVINRLNAEIKTLKLLEETQTQSEELESQQEELRQVNDELREQRNRLEASEEELKANEEELQEKNAELEEKANELEEQYESLRFKNNELEETRDTLKIQMEQLQSVSKYKSEFLANMSHELRTPLNSILILSRILKDNNQKTLNQKQIEHAEVIERSGNDLLRLINEILDLARIESGKVKLELQQIKINELGLETQFREIAGQRKIDFKMTIAENVPSTIYSDRFRLEQVLKNLLSNAFKFTGEHGKVALEIFVPSKDVKFKNDALKGRPVIGFSVKDSGIGISPDKQQIIFEAFQQADSSTTRKFGGTGLGLSISRELAILLGGEIQLESQEKVGSTFTLYVPKALDQKIEISEPEKPAEKIVKTEPAVFQKKEFKNEDKSAQEKSILIIEDDVYFRKILEDYATARGYIVYSSESGEEGISLAMEHMPGAILLDIQLPDINGWEVLGRIKNTDKLKNIPVHIMSSFDREADQKDLGQAEFIAKPVSIEKLDQAFNDISNQLRKPIQKILIVEDNEIENNAVKELLGTQDLMADSALNGQDALKMLNTETYDCVILDINLPDIGGYDLLEKIKTTKKFKDLNVIIYSGKDLSEAEEARFKKYTNTIIIKTEYSYTRLLEEVKLFLHNIQQNLYKKSTVITHLHKKEEQLKEKKVLVVDDDIRNIYSLNNVLEQEGMKIVVAYDGKQALNELDKNDDIDIVLMDVMMPEMDGIEATKKIRTMLKYKNLPIIALTAKAMKGDREKCIDAGASDYISKPVDIDKLLSLMRVWLYDKTNKFM